MKSVQMAPMTTLKQRATRFGLGLGLAATLALSAVMPALAAPDPAAGTLGIEGASNVAYTFPQSLALTDSVTSNPISLLDGKDHIATGQVVIGVTDYTGSHAGWGLQISSAGFKKDGVGTALAGFAITGVTDAHATSDTGSYTNPVNDILPGNVPTSASPFYTANPGTGVGKFDLTTTFTLPVPATTLAGTYTATIMIDTTDAP